MREVCNSVSGEDGGRSAKNQSGWALFPRIRALHIFTTDVLCLSLAVDGFRVLLICFWLRFGVIITIAC